MYTQFQHRTGVLFAGLPLGHTEAQVKLCSCTFTAIYRGKSPRCFIPNCDPDPQTAAFNAPYMTDMKFAEHNSCQRLAQIQSSSNSSQTNCSALQFTNITETCDQYVFDTTEFRSTVVTEVWLRLSGAVPSHNV